MVEISGTAERGRSAELRPGHWRRDGHGRRKPSQELPPAAKVTTNKVHPARVTAVLAAAKFTGRLSRALRRGNGDALPGRLAELLLPQLPAILAGQLGRGIIIVTGTNGKTSTTKMLDEILTRGGERVVSNRSGSNLRQGIASTLIAAADVRGRLRGNPTIGLFEVDEASVPLVIEEIGATHLLVANLFRDQLDRFGEVGAVAATLGAAISGSGVSVYLNADDPLVASLGRYAEPGRVHYFGLDADHQSADALRTAADSVHCPACGNRLWFDRTFYSHLGYYRCPEGDFTRPQPTVTASEIDPDEATGSSFTIRTQHGQHRAAMRLGGLYNIYNATAALTLADAVGVPTVSALQSLEQSTPAFGRLEDILWDGRHLRLVLVKNPAGCTQVLQSLLRAETRICVLVAVNDFEADGRDVSWLWDVPFECLTGQRHRIVITGGRSDDLALRLRYAEVASTVITGTSQALGEVYRLTEPGSTAYLLATYTAMLSIRRSLGQHVPLPPIGTPRS